MSTQGYVNSLEAVNELRNGYTGLASDGTKVLVPGLNTLMQATGQINVSTVKALDSTTKFTKALMDQKVGLGQVLGNYKQFSAQLKEATTQQTALQKASAMQWTTKSGQNQIDLYVPKDITSELTDARTKYGMINYAIGQIGQNTLNWGKNTQWAGRQITAGLSMPIAIAAAGLAKLSLDTDKELTQITKVYNTSTTAATGSMQAQAQAQQELSQVRVQSLQVATQMAQEYGAKLSDTLNIESQLAALGATGNNLYTSTAQVMRIATLGDLDYNTALQMTMTLMNAFHETGNDLANTFNFINAVENQTSLTTKDVADALPRAGAAMASLGMNVKETVVLLTAFKEGGVEATAGANALKTAVARAFDPVPKAQKEFQALGIDIKSVVHDSGGDFLKFMEELSVRMDGLSGMQKETALKDLFGIQQSNRLLTVLNNLAEVTMNKIPAGFAQTATAFKLMSASAASNASVADQEIKTFQQSASGQFKIAIASIQAELVKLGDPIMKALTPVIHVITGLFATFNNAPSIVKTFVAALAIIATVAGPIIMLVGLFANLFGNAMRFGSAIGNLFLKFKPLTEAEAAEQAIAKLATQTYNQEAQAVALLAQKMGQLNTIMAEQIQIQKSVMGFTEATTDATAGLTSAQQAAAGAAGQLATQENAVAGAENAAAGATRSATAAAAAQASAIPNLPYTRLTPVGANDRRRYGVTTPVAPSSLIAQQQSEMEAAGLIPVYTGAVQESVAAKRSMFSRFFRRGGVDGALQTTNRLGNLPPVPAPITSQEARTIQQAEQNTEQMANQAARTGMNFTKAVGAVAGFGMGVYSIKAMADGSGSIMTNILNATMAIASWGMFFKAINISKIFGGISTGIANLGTEASVFSGLWTKIWTGIKSGGTGVLNLLKGGIAALLTPVGLVTAGVVALGAAIYIAYEQSTKLSRAQEEVNKSADAWAKILGYTQNTAKSLGEVNAATAGGITATQARAKAVNDLKDANGALVDQLQAAKNAGGTGFGNDGLFNLAMGEAIKVKVSGGDVAQAKEAFEVALQAAGLNQMQINNLDVRFNSVNLDDPSQIVQQLMTDIQTSMNNMNPTDLGASWFRHKMFGADDSDAAQANAEKVANDFYNSLLSVSGNSDMENQVAKNMQDNINRLFQPDFNQLRNKNKKLYHDMAINNFQDLAKAVQDAEDAELKGPGHASANQESLLNSLFGAPNEDGSRYGENSQFATYSAYIKQFLTEVGKEAGLTGKDLDNFVNNSNNMKQALIALGGGAADSANGTKQAGDAAQQAGNQAGQAAGGFKTLADAMKVDPSTLHLTDASQYINEMKSAYQGAVQTMTGIASNLMSRTQQAQQAGIQAAGDARQAAMQKQQKQQDAAYDAQTKASQDALAAQKKAIEKHYKDLGTMYDNQIKQAQDNAKAQTDAIQAQIDALNKEDTTRQKLFDNEKTRIQRLAQLQNNSVDFNQALNSGNLDAAAKVYSNTASTVSGWALDDQQQAMDDASKAQQDALQKQIDSINNSTQTYVDAIQKKKDALSDLQQAEEDAADAAAQATQDQIAKQKQAYDDGMQAAEQADQKKTQSALSSNQTMWQDKQVKLQMELQAITASIPQTDAQYQQQIKDIEALYAKYGVDLQGYAGAWGGNIGDALTYNMQQAAAGLQNDIGWSQISTFVQSQLDANSGLTMDQVAQYLRTGNWPAASGNTQPPKQWFAPPKPNQETYNPNTGQSQWHNSTGSGGRFYAGGFTGFGGKFDPAGIVHKGEFVFPQESVKALGIPFLGALAGLPGYANGGLVRDLIQTHMLARAATELTAGKKAIANAHDQYVNSLLPQYYGDAALGAAPTNVSGNKAIVQKQAAAYGWTGAEWNALYALIMRESGFRNTAQNPTSTAYGMFQFLNSTWRSYGIAKTSDPYWQTVAGLRYLQSRYGDPLSAWAHETRYGWYDNGGMLMPGMVGLNGTGKPEPVFTDEQWSIMSSLIANTTTMAAAMSEAAMGTASGIANEGGNTYNVTVDMTGATFQSDIDVEKAVVNALSKLDYKYGRSRTIG